MTSVAPTCLLPLLPSQRPPRPSSFARNLTFNAHQLPHSPRQRFSRELSDLAGPALADSFYQDFLREFDVALELEEGADLDDGYACTPQSPKVGTGADDFAALAATPERDPRRCQILNGSPSSTNSSPKTTTSSVFSNETDVFRLSNGGSRHSGQRRPLSHTPSTPIRHSKVVLPFEPLGDLELPFVRPYSCDASKRIPVVSLERGIPPARAPLPVLARHSKLLGCQEEPFRLSTLVSTALLASHRRSVQITRLEDTLAVTRPVSVALEAPVPTPIPQEPRSRFSFTRLRNAMQKKKGGVTKDMISAPCELQEADPLESVPRSLPSRPASMGVFTPLAPAVRPVSAMTGEMVVPAAYMQVNNLMDEYYRRELVIQEEAEVKKPPFTAHSSNQTASTITSKRQSQGPSDKRASISRFSLKASPAS